MTDNDTQYDGQYAEGGRVYPPKPVLLEKQGNAAIRSILSLLIYAVLFYLMFDNNIAYIAALLLVIVIHEMGHFVFMKMFHYSNVKIFIVPLLGAYTTGKKQQVSQRQLALIILGGPVPGIVIGCVLYWLNRDWNDDTVRMLYRTFLAINLLNCLPIYPLDGGRLLETLFFKENHILRLVFGIISILVLVTLCFVLVSPFLAVIPFFIGMELYNENKHEKIREYLRQERIDHYTDYDNLPDKDYWLIRDCLILSFPKKYGGLQPGDYQYSTVEPMLVNHVTAVLRVNLKADAGLAGKIGFVLFYLALFIVPLLLFLLSI